MNCDCEKEIKKLWEHFQKLHLILSETNKLQKYQQGVICKFMLQNIEVKDKEC